MRARIVVAGRGDPLLVEFGRWLLNDGQDVLVLGGPTSSPADVTARLPLDEGAEAIEREVMQLMSAHGVLDGVVISLEGPGEREALSSTGDDVADWRLAVEDDLSLAFALTKAFGRAMTRARRGKLVLVSGIAGRLARDASVAHYTLDAGLSMFIRATAREMALYNIMVNGVFCDCGAPGTVNLSRRRMAQTVPLRRLGGPEEVFGTVKFLLSASSNHITGQVLRLDGGLCC